MYFRKQQDEHDRLKIAKEEVKRERREAEQRGAGDHDDDDEESSSPTDHRPKRERKKKKFFDGEVGSFKILAKVMINNCSVLIDIKGSLRHLEYLIKYNITLL